MLLSLLVSFTFLLFVPLVPFVFLSRLLLFLFLCLLIFLLHFRLVLFLLLRSLTRSFLFPFSLLLFQSPLVFLRFLMRLPYFLLFPYLLSLLFHLPVFPVPSCCLFWIVGFGCLLVFSLVCLFCCYLLPSVSSPLPSLVPTMFSLGSSAPTSSSIVASVPSPTLAPSAAFAPSLVTTVPCSSTDVSPGPGFSSAFRGVGDGGRVPHVLILLMFQAPRVSLFRLLIHCHSVAATCLVLRATGGLLPWGSLISRLPFSQGRVSF